MRRLLTCIASFLVYFKFALEAVRMRVRARRRSLHARYTEANDNKRESGDSVVALCKTAVHAFLCLASSKLLVTSHSPCLSFCFIKRWQCVNAGNVLITQVLVILIIFK